MPKPQTSTQSIQGHITVLILLVYAIHPPLNLFFIIPITHPQPYLDQEINYIHTQHYFQIPPTQSTNNPSDASWSFNPHIISQFHNLIQDIVHIHTYSWQTLPIKNPSPNPILLTQHTPTNTTHIPKSFWTKLSIINPILSMPHSSQCLSPIQLIEFV